MNNESIEIYEQPGAVEIVIEEGEGYVAGEPGLHSNLSDRNNDNQHVITSITGLRDELDMIESPRTLYSDKESVASYYKWGGGANNTWGYFVSMIPDSSTIQICNTLDVFGVVVRNKNAGFVGGKDGEFDGATCGIVVTFGRVDVRCASNVQIGDYVVPGVDGSAVKTNGLPYGYKVYAIDTIEGHRCASIILGAQSDVVYKLGDQLDKAKKQIDINEVNINNAINSAKDAMTKADEATSSGTETSEKLDEISNKVDQTQADIGDLNDAVDRVESSVNQAVTTANNAMTSAKQAVVETSNFRDDLDSQSKQIANVDGKVTVVTKKTSGKYEIVETIDGVNKKDDTVYYAQDTQTYHYYDYDNVKWEETSNSRDAGLTVAMAGIQVATDSNSSSINGLVEWQDETNVSMARIEQKADATGAYIKNIVIDIDKYNVGPYSPAYGFTLEQAMEVLEDGMIYVPIEDQTEENGKCERYRRVDEATPYPDGDDDLDITKVYYEVDGESKQYYYWACDLDTNEYKWLRTEEFPIYYTREFLRGYLYKWSILPSKLYGWIPVDKNYSAIDDINTSDPCVYFSNQEIAIYKDNDNDNYGYWYTEVTDDNQKIIDIAGNETDAYSARTLYKWKSYDVVTEEGSTNTQDGVWTAVATLAGNISNRSVSQIKQYADSISLEVANVKGDVASINATVGDTYSEISSLTSWKNGEEDSSAIITQRAGEDGPEIVISTFQQDGDDVVSQARLTLAVNPDDGSSLRINADNINFTATADYSVIAENIEFSADNIDLTGYVTIEDLQGSGTTTINGANIISGTISGDQINSDGLVVNQNASIGCWNVGTIPNPGNNFWGEYTYSNSLYTISASGQDVGINNESDLTSQTSDCYLTFLRLPKGDGSHVMAIRHKLYKDGTFGDAETKFSIAKNGHLFASSAEITGIINADFGSIGGWSIDGGGIAKKFNVTSGEYVGNYMVGVFSGLYQGRIESSTSFYVEKDGEWQFYVRPTGEMAAKKANITGNINANGGKIGNLIISTDGLKHIKDNKEVYTLDGHGLIINTPDSKIKVGNVSIARQQNTNRTVIEASDELVIRGQNDTEIHLMHLADTTHIEELYVTCHAGEGPLWSTVFSVRARIKNPLRYDLDAEIRYRILNKDHDVLEEVVCTCTIPANETHSSLTQLNTPYSGHIIQFYDNINNEWLSKRSVVDGDFEELVDTAIMIEKSNSVGIRGNLYPMLTSTDEDNGYNLGIPGNVWNTVYARNPTISSSDRNKKTNIHPLSDVYMQIFDSLRPVSYKFKISNNDRTHTGLIAQDVKMAVECAGITTQDFAGYCEWTNSDGVIECGLRYSEFVSLCIDQIQKLKPRVATLEEKVQALEVENTQLKEQMAQLLSQN